MCCTELPFCLPRITSLLVTEVPKAPAHISELENLDEMDEFLDTYKLPNFNQEAMENQNKSTTKNGTKVVIKKFPKKKSPVLDPCLKIILNFKK